jgi:hypothetical protein
MNISFHVKIICINETETLANKGNLAKFPLFAVFYRFCPKAGNSMYVNNL